MTYIPSFLTTLASSGSFALREQSADVRDEFLAGNAGQIEEASFSKMLGGAIQSTNSPRDTGLDVADDATPLDQQLAKFRAMNVAYDETAGLSAPHGFNSGDAETAANAMTPEFTGLLQDTLKQAGFNIGKNYQLTTNTMGELRISGTSQDAQINAFLKDKVDIQQSYARIMQGYEMAEMGREAGVTDRAYTAAYQTGNDAFISQVVNRIIASQFHSTAMAVNDGQVTVLYEGKTSDQRMAMLLKMFGDLLNAM